MQDLRKKLSRGTREKEKSQNMTKKQLEGKENKISSDVRSKDFSSFATLHDAVCLYLLLGATKILGIFVL
jgi:hypothetical protein